MKGVAQFCAIAFVAVAVSSCDDADFQALLDNSAIASDQVGFVPSESFPSRNTKYDGYLPAEKAVVSDAALSTLFNFVAMPQSRSAIRGLLGDEFAEDGDVSYWRLSGGSELAVFFSGDTAYKYTVGY